MGYAYYVLDDGREAGYGVAATCDQADCHAQIDRGLSYLCGGLMPGDTSGNACSGYFCEQHLFMAPDGITETQLCGACFDALDTTPHAEPRSHARS